MTEPSSSRDPIFSLSDEFVDAFAVACPVDASLVGVACDAGAWNDWSPAGVAAWGSTLTSFRERLHALPPVASNPWASLARRVMANYLDERLDEQAHGEHLVNLNNIDSTLQHMRMVFDMMDTSSAAGWEAVLRRLETVDRAAKSYQASLEEGRRSGKVVAKRQVQAGITQAEHQAGPSSFFLTLLSTAEAAEKATPGSVSVAVLERLPAAVENARRTFGELARYLAETYLPDASEVDGVGEARYQRASRRFLGANIDLRETYAWGWAEVRRIEAEMAALAEQIQPGATVPEVIRMLEQDPARCAGSLDEFLELMRERQARALADLEGVHFDVPEPIRRIEVKLAPPGGALGAYYLPPSEGFKRPGTIWYAPGEVCQVPLYGEISTAYHEGFPGHHLQCGLQVYFEEQLSRVHRFLVMYSGYAEGWALYAEQLMGELGYFEKPEYVLGMLAAKLMRAYRVVIDIGMHLDLPIPKDAPAHGGERWSYEAAVEMMEGRAFMASDHARSEVTRYLGWPGQAISYKVGERVMLELRAEMRRRQAEAFDLKAFHGKVLGAGSVGLDLLRELVLNEA
ncbi:DUF885 domain-containing protein [Chondromyces crocatus]|uniref:DUF885 domain-containing protein n=1 Tax=Chondromyces crocatus TaxID=52 RepID=A0A0K1ENC5_CHOCO|nr:DUF885 domain-containing protein [Chondromyces crocatus]AKT42346.1 uncharacterized protein CMC5_065720 [Chondromyces crocatus]